jgi:hypothetical protein
MDMGTLRTGAVAARDTRDDRADRRRPSTARHRTGPIDA